MKKLNYKSYDGNFYRVVFRDWTQKEGTDYFSSTYDSKTPLPISWVGSNFRSEKWKFFEVIKAENEETANPIVKIGEAGSRCPYCQDRRCLKSEFSLGISWAPSLSDTEEFTYSRAISYCLNPKYYKKYFVIEYRNTRRHALNMLLKKQCPICKGHNSIELFDWTDFNTDIMRKALAFLNPRSKNLLLRFRTLEYHCKICDCGAISILKTGTKEKYFERLVDVYLK